MANLPDWLSTAFASPLFGADHRQLTTDFTRRQPHGALPLFIWKELAAHCDFHPVAIWVIHFLDIHRKIDRAHDAIAELFVNQLFDCLAVNQVNFVKAVKERIFGNVQNISLRGKLLENGRSFRRQLEKRDKVVRLFG